MTQTHVALLCRIYNVIWMQMSKSLGNIVDPHQIIDTFGLDTVRYFLIKEGETPINYFGRVRALGATELKPFSGSIQTDGDFTVDRLKATYIADLADK